MKKATVSYVNIKGKYFVFLLLFYSVFVSSAYAVELNCSANYQVSHTFNNGAVWDMCWERNDREGIILHEVHYTAVNGIRRRVLAQANVAQIHVPYDDDIARFHDVSDYGLGNEGHLNNLQVEDCPNGVLLTENGKNIICKTVYDRGSAVATGTEHHRGEALSLFSVSHVGAYNYIPDWHFFDDGSIEPSMGATGKLQRYTYSANRGWLVRQFMAPYGLSHLHNYFWRLDFDLGEDGTDDVFEEIEFVAENNNSFSREKSITPFTTEIARSINRDTARFWRVRDKNLSNADGLNISYEIVPLETGHRDVGPESEPWTHNDIYVSRNRACERFTSHNPVDHLGGCLAIGNVSSFINSESLDGNDLVVWFGLSFHHTPRDEDEPYMHAHWNKFRIAPRDWVAGLPATIPPPGSNHAPVLTDPVAQSHVINSVINLQINANDADGDALSYSATGLPSGLTINTQTGVISGTASSAGTFNVTVSVSDGQVSDSAAFVWVINAIVIPPTPANELQNGVVLTDLAAATGDQTVYVVNPGAGGTLQIVMTGGGGDADLYVRYGSEPTLSQFDCRPYRAGNHEICTINNTQAGTYHVMVHAYISYSGLSLQAIFDSVSANTAPVINSPGNQNTNRGNNINLPIIANDADGDTLSYSATGLPGGLTINTQTGVISGTANSVGVFNVTLSVTDAQAVDSVAFVWTILAPANTAPVLTNPGAQNHELSEGVNVPMIANDADGDTLSYSATGLPGGLTINNQTGVISGTASSAGTFNVTVFVSDGQVSDSAAFIWVINAIVIPPTPANELQNGVVLTDLAAATGDQTVYVVNPGAGGTLQIVMTGGGGDADLYVRYGSEPTLSQFDCRPYRAGNHEICTINNTQAGTYHVMVHAFISYSGLSLQAIFDSVSANTAPVINSPGNQNTNRGDNINLPIIANDADGDTLSFSATGLPGGLTINTQTGVISGTANSAGVFNVTLSVTDAQAVDSVAFVWTILAPANTAPVLTNPGAQNHELGEGVNVSMIANDGDGDTLSYSATGLPGGLTINTQTGVISGTANSAGVFNVTLSVTDAQAADSVVFVWTILAPANTAPVLTNPGAQNHELGEGVNVSMIANDADGDTLSYSATGLPGGLTINNQTGVISGTASSAGTFNVTVSVSDGQVSDSAAFVWVINAIVIPPTPANELQNGVVLTDLVATTGNQTVYVVNPGAGSTLQIVIAGGSGDADLYVRYGSEPTLSQFDCRPYRAGNYETCTINNTQAGAYYVMLHAYIGYFSVSLTTNY